MRRLPHIFRATPVLSTNALPSYGWGRFPHNFRATGLFFRGTSELERGDFRTSSELRSAEASTPLVKGVLPHKASPQAIPSPLKGHAGPPRLCGHDLRAEVRDLRGGHRSQLRCLRSPRLRPDRCVLREHRLRVPTFWAGAHLEDG